MSRLPLFIAATLATLFVSEQLTLVQAQVKMKNTFEIGAIYPLDFYGQVKTIRESESDTKGLIFNVDAAQTNAKVTTLSGSLDSTIKLDRKNRTITLQEITKDGKQTSITQYNNLGCPVSRKNYFPDFTSTSARTCDTQNKILQERNILKYIGQQKPFLDYTEVYAWSEDGKQATIYQRPNDGGEEQETISRYNANGHEIYHSVTKSSVRQVEIETSYSYDAKGNWIQRVIKYTAYRSGEADKPSIQIATRKIVYFP
jgi:hypothetical protein